MKLLTLSLLMFISIIAFSNVVPAFSCDATRGCSPLVVNVTDQSSGATTWLWDLGNGNTSTQKNPAATYSNPGTYRIRLIVSDGTTTDSTTQIITVNRKPIADFTASRLTACPYDSIGFNAVLTVGDAPISHFAWGFGNGTGSDSMNTSYRYTRGGLYSITLVVLDSNGCTANMTKPDYLQVWDAPEAALTVTPEVSCGSSQLVTFTDQTQGTGFTSVLSFGDGTTSATTSTTHTYTYGKYKPVLTVTNARGCVSTVQKSAAVINLAASFRADKVVACAGEEITFTNMSPMAGSYWAWQFGDGTVSGKQNPKHVYANPGLYTVKFVIADGTCRDSVVKTAYIRITTGFSLSFVPDQRNACSPPLTVHFTTTASTSVVSYAWDFGNGTVDSSANPTAIYNEANTFSVSLTAVDSNGCKVKMTSPGLISTSKPLTKFISDSIACPGAFIAMYNRTPNGGSRYRWAFGDGDTANVPNPSHRYRNSGVYSVRFTVTDSIGCDSTQTKLNYIHVQPAHVDFTVGQTFSLCPPLVTNFQSVVNRPDMKLRWDFGDGYTDTAVNPTHIFFHPGVYTVKLIGAVPGGCSDTISYPNLIVVQGPTGQFSVSSNNGCVPLTVKFAGSASASTARVTCDLGNGILRNDSLSFSYTYTSARIYHPKFILTDQVGCSIPFDLDSIITKAQPALRLQDTTICAGQSVNMALGSDHYSWTARVCDTCGRIPNITDTTAVAHLSPLANTNYSVTATNAFGCTATGQFHINVKQMERLAARDTISLCQNETVSLGNTTGDSIRWIPATYLNNTAASAPLCTPAESITYTALTYNRAGCATVQEVPVSVRHLRVLPPREAVTLCQHESVNLGTVAGDSISWKPSGYLDNPAGAAPVCTPGSSVNYTVYAYNKVGCNTSQEVPVHVLKKVTVALSADSGVCPGGAVRMSVSAIDTSRQGVSYAWSPAQYLDNSNINNVTAQMQSQTQKFTVITTSGGCTPDTSHISVLVHQSASVKLPATITTVTMAEVPLTIASGDLVSYSWTAAGTLSCADCKATTLVPAESQIVYLSGADEHGCRARDSMYIHVLQCDPESIFVPNTFTPNGDGVHDMLYLHSRTLSQLDAFRVYDRWGAVVFETHDLTGGWDGTIGGKPATQGVFLYTVKGKCDNGYDVEKNGTITLIR